MKLGIMQPYFFPYIGYFQLINAVDEFLVYDNVNFIKKGWINRNNILINGNPYLINVPLKSKSSFVKIKDIEIDDSLKWRKKILSDISTNYKRAKCFKDVYPIIEETINFKTSKVSEINFQSIKSVCDYLEINTKLSNDISAFFDLEAKLNNPSIDKLTFPNISLNHYEHKVVRVVEICKIKNAKTYINPIGGTDLYSKDEFLMNDIDLKFIKTGEITYPQFGNKFVPFLSIIDVLMFNSKDEIKNLLNNYDFI